MKAIGETIILEPLKMESKTQAGIVIAQDQYKKHDSELSVGVVIAMGPIAYLEEKKYEIDFNQHKSVPKPEIGDYVLTARYAGSQIKIGDDIRKLCLPGDILATITEDEVKKMTTWVIDKNAA